MSNSPINLRAGRVAADEVRPAGEQVRARLVAGLPVAESRRELAGISTAVLEGGAGEPLVLLHGQGEFAATWAEVLPDLVGTHRVILPDLPGHGASGIGDRALDADRLVAWLGELVDRTCDTPPVLAGHLLGGAIAARFAAAHGERIRGLVLVDSLGLARYRPSPRFALAMTGFVVRPTERSRDRLFERCFLDFDAVREQVGDRWDLLAAYALDRARTPELKAALRTMMPRIGIGAIPPEQLDRITVPTSLIHGRDDLQVAVGVAESAAARYGWPLHVIDGAADDPAFEQPSAFLDALRAALGAA